jgi:hypothetical protein
MDQVLESSRRLMVDDYSYSGLTERVERPRQKGARKFKVETKLHEHEIEMRSDRQTDKRAVSTVSFLCCSDELVCIGGDQLSDTKG